MKTVSALAKELNISPQAIYKKINNQLKNELSTHIHKGLKGKTLIDEQGQAIIKESLNLVFKPVDETSSQSVDNEFKEKNTLNDSLVEVLKKQLEVKDEQIGELLKQNDSLIKKIENMQVLLKNEQDRVLMIAEGKEEIQPTKHSFWGKLFKSKNE